MQTVFDSVTNKSVDFDDNVTPSQMKTAFDDFNNGTIKNPPATVGNWFEKNIQQFTPKEISEPVVNLGRAASTGFWSVATPTAKFLYHAVNGLVAEHEWPDLPLPEPGEEGVKQAQRQNQLGFLVGGFAGSLPGFKIAEVVGVGIIKAAAPFAEQVPMIKTLLDSFRAGLEAKSSVAMGVEGAARFGAGSAGLEAAINSEQQKDTYGDVDFRDLFREAMKQGVIGAAAGGVLGSTARALSEIAPEEQATEIAKRLMTSGGVGYAMTRASGGSHEDAMLNAVLFAGATALHTHGEHAAVRKAVIEDTQNAIGDNVSHNLPLAAPGAGDDIAKGVLQQKITDVLAKYQAKADEFTAKIQEEAPDLQPNDNIARDENGKPIEINVTPEMENAAPAPEGEKPVEVNPVEQFPAEQIVASSPEMTTDLIKDTVKELNGGEDMFPDVPAKEKKLNEKPSYFEVVNPVGDVEQKFDTQKQAEAGKQDGDTVRPNIFTPDEQTLEDFIYRNRESGYSKQELKDIHEKAVTESVMSGKMRDYGDEDYDPVLQDYPEIYSDIMSAYDRVEQKKLTPIFGNDKVDPRLIFRLNTMIAETGKQFTKVGEFSPDGRSVVVSGATVKDFKDSRGMMGKPLDAVKDGENVKLSLPTLEAEKPLTKETKKTEPAGSKEKYKTVGGQKLTPESFNQLQENIYKDLGIESNQLPYSHGVKPKGRVPAIWTTDEALKIKDYIESETGYSAVIGKNDKGNIIGVTIDYWQPNVKKPAGKIADFGEKAPGHVVMQDAKTGKWFVYKIVAGGKLGEVRKIGKGFETEKEASAAIPRKPVDVKEQIDNMTAGFHIRDTLVMPEKLKTLPPENAKRILEIKDEFSKLGYIDARTELGPDQQRRMSQGQIDKMDKIRQKAVALESEVKELLKTPEEVGKEKFDKSIQDIDKKIASLSNRKGQIEDFLGDKLKSTRQNSTKTEYADVIKQIKDLEESKKALNVLPRKAKVEAPITSDEEMSRLKALNAEGKQNLKDLQDGKITHSEYLDRSHDLKQRIKDVPHAPESRPSDFKTAEEYVASKGNENPVISAFKKAEKSDKVKLPEGWFLHADLGNKYSDKIISGKHSVQFYGSDASDPWVYADWSGEKGYFAVKPNKDAKIIDLSSTNTNDSSALLDKLNEQIESGKVEETSLEHIKEYLDNGETADEIIDSFSPEEIGNSAEAYDNVDFVNWLRETSGADFVITPNGGVLIGDANKLEQIKLSKYTKSQLTSEWQAAQKDTPKMSATKADDTVPEFSKTKSASKKAQEVDAYKKYAVGKQYKSYGGNIDEILDVTKGGVDGSFVYKVKDVKSGDIREHSTFIPANKMSKLFGSENTVFTKEIKDVAEKSFKEKTGGLHANIDPTAMADLVKIGGYYIEGGIRDFGKFSEKMIEDFGETIKPYIKQVWDEVQVKLPKEQPEGGKVRGLSESVDESATRKGITKGISDLPTYEVRHAKDVSDFIENNYEKAKSIALGELPEEGDIRAQELFTGLRIKAEMEGDVNTIRDLALNEKASAMATELGQRVQALDANDPDSPVSAVKDIKKTREAAVEGKLGKGRLKAEKKTEVVKIKKAMKESVKKLDWEGFLASLEC